MADWDDTERHTSPDGRLLIERHRAYDPADLHEIAEQRRAVVLDAATGETLIDLRRFNGGSPFAWTADGGLELGAVNGVQILVAPGGRSFSTNADGGIPHPIAEAEARLAVLLAPPAPPPPTPAERWEQVKNGAALLAAFGAIVFIGWGWWWGGESAKPDVTPAGTINAWSVTCPEPLGFVAMHLDDAGRLVVPAKIAAAPLPPLGGGRYGDGRATVSASGAGATIERTGAPAVSCLSGRGG